MERKSFASESGATITYFIVFVLSKLWFQVDSFKDLNNGGHSLIRTLSTTLFKGKRG